MTNSEIQTSTTSFLLRWAEQVSAFEKKGKLEERSRSAFRTWALGPLQKIVGFTSRYVLTIIAVLIRPKLLHTVVNSPTNPFLSARAFVLSTIALYELIGGQFVYIDALEAMSNAIVKNIAMMAASILALLFLIGIFSMICWVGSRIAKAPLDFEHSTKLAAYAAGVIPVVQIVTALPVVIMSPSMMQSMVNFWVVFALTTSLIVGGVIYLIHVTFIVPVLILRPSSSRSRLWLGWWIGWLVGMLSMGSMLMLTRYFLPGQSFKVGF